MRKITIWDMDFYYKKSFLPNPIAMKLSSYHKQQGDLINFVTEEFHIGMSFDLFYLIKEKKNTPKPPRKLLDNINVKLIGKPLRFFDHYWEINSIIAATRPDYMLYPENPRNSYYNANVVQFYYNNKRLKIKQPFINTLKFHKKTLVIDKNFWAASEEDIIICLLELQEYKNIAFLYPIDVKKILKNEKIKKLFIDLDFSQGTTFKFRNSYGSSFADAQVIFKFLVELKEKHSQVRFTNMPFKAVVSDHSKSENAVRDLKRCLQIADAAKKDKIHIRIVSPACRFDSPYWFYFETLEFWTLRLEKISYIEMMLHSASQKTGEPWWAILNNSSKWDTPNTYFLLQLLIKAEWCFDLSSRKWGETFIDKSIINWEEIKKYIGKDDSYLIKNKV